MTRYAKDTSVGVEKSRQEIERTLTRYGAEKFVYGWDRSSAMIGFELERRQIRMVLALPDKQSREFTHTPARGTERHPAEAERCWEQACRQRWRALALVVKAKLEAVEAGISTFDNEFLAYIALPNGQTVGELALPQIESMYSTRKMLPLLPSGSKD